MKLKVSKIGKIVFSLALVLILVLVIFIFKYKSSISEVHKMESNDFFDIKIDYELTHNKDIDKLVENFIKSKKEEFIGVVDESGKVQRGKYNLIIDVNNKTYNDVISVHGTSFSYTGGAHYVREDMAYVYDKDKGKYINFKDILVSEDFDKIHSIILESIYEYAKLNNIILDDEWLKEGTSYSTNNYQNFSLDENGLNILFPPYQIASWAAGEINISIPYEKLDGILKEEYLDKKDTTSIDSIIKPSKRDLDKFKDKKLIAFTFDDGPNTLTTTRLLDGLAAYDAKVTFFVLGSRVESNKEVLKRAYEEGNQIGSHTYNHLNLFLLDPASILAEINNTNNVIYEVIGKEPELLRPPYGNINADIKSIANMHIINWDVDTEDWKLKDRNRIKDKILEDAHDGAIVLLHDIYKESVEGALLAMEELEKENYAFVTIEEMVQLRGVNLDFDTTYYNFLKE